jgi:biopolymer transport protein ExbD
LPKLRGAISLPHAMREDAMIVTIMRDGAVFFRNDRVSPECLADAIRKDVESGSEKRVYIRADARALYRTVKQVLDAVQQAGLVNVSFLADQRRSR